MAAIRDAQGAIQQVTPDVSWYLAAADAGLSFEQFVNKQHDTDATKYGSVYHQMLASEGIVIRPNREFGLPSTRMADIMSGRPDMSAGVLTKSSDFASAALRTLFPSAILTAVEDRLVADLNMNADAFDSLVAIEDVIQGDKFERPLLNYTNPTGARSRAIAQLAAPISMLSITVASVSRTIPTLALGMEISDQAKAATTLDLVSLAMARQVAVERSVRADEYFLALLQGDADVGMASLSSLGYTVNSSTLDAAATSAATFTHKCWMKWLYRNSKKRVIDWVVTDINGALAIENRVGKPTNVTDNPNSVRIDSVLQVGNPTWKSNVKVFITDDVNWPANTIMGFDSRYGIHRVSSSTISYQAVEQFVLRRAEGLRVDFGEIAYRLFDDAYDTLVFA